MTYTVKAAVCFQIRTKHSMQREHHEEFLNVKTGGTYRNRLALKFFFYMALRPNAGHGLKRQPPGSLS
jgi:hypothetical protein